MITRGMGMRMTAESPPEFVKSWQSVWHSLYRRVNVWGSIWRLQPQRKLPVIVRLQHSHIIFIFTFIFTAPSPYLNQIPHRETLMNTITRKILSLRLPLTFNFQFWLMHLQNSKTFCWALILKCPAQSCWSCAFKTSWYVSGTLAFHWEHLK